MDQSDVYSDYFTQQANFENKLKSIIPENAREIDFSLVRQYGCLFELLNIIMNWSGKDIIIRNEIIKNNIPSVQLAYYLKDLIYKQTENISDISDKSLRKLEQQKFSKLLSEYLLSLSQNNLLTQDDLRDTILHTNIMSYLLTDGDILSDSVISIIKKLSWIKQNEVLITLIQQYCKNNNDANLANIKTLQKIVTLGHQGTCYGTKVIDSAIKLIEDKDLLSNSIKINALLKEGQDIPQIQNEVEMLQIAVLIENKELAERLLTSNPQLLYAKNSDGISLVEFCGLFLCADNSFVKIIVDNYYEDTSTEQNKNLSYDLALFLKDVVPEIIYQTTNPLFKLVKKDFTLTNSFFNDNKTHILIASDEGDWSSSFLRLSVILHNNFPDVDFHIINNNTWEKSDKNLLAKFDGFIIPASDDQYPSKSPFNLIDMEEGNFLPLNKLSISMLKFAQENNIPSIGSCAGAQATILASGGSLMRLEQSRLENDGIEVEIKPGTMPYFMSLPRQLQSSILNAHQDNYPKSLIIKGDINCGFVAVSNQLGKNVKLAGSTTDPNHYPMCYSNKLLFATQYHPEILYLMTKYIGTYQGEQQNYIDSFINFAKIHHDHGGEFLAKHVENIETNLRDLFGHNDEVESFIGDVQQDGDPLLGQYTEGYALAA